jgi:glycosyltransferase involved in cell wall biosynthesis
MSMLISIITPTFNSAATLPRTLASVQQQSYSAYEQIVVDGGSTDDTQAILAAAARDSSLRWNGEPDAGIADAFNKGIAQASGELVLILNSDDWLHAGALATMAAAHAARRNAGLPAAILHGDMLQHVADEASHSHSPVRIRPRRWGGRDGIGRAFWFDMPVCHPTCFVPREIYQRVGNFRTDYCVAMDYEWLLRAFRAGEPFQYVPEIITHFQTGGASGRNTRLAIAEVRRAQVEQRVYPIAGRFSHWGKLAVNRLKALSQSTPVRTG